MEQAAFDGWIVQIQVGLRAGNDIEKSDQYQESLDEAAEKTQIFINYVEMLTTSRSKSIVSLVLPALIEGVTNIVEGYRETEKERREEIIKDLDQLKWKSFDEI